MLHGYHCPLALYSKKFAVYLLRFPPWIGHFNHLDSNRHKRTLVHVLKSVFTASISILLILWYLQLILSFPHCCSQYLDAVTKVCRVIGYNKFIALLSLKLWAFIVDILQCCVIRWYCVNWNQQPTVTALWYN